MAQDLARLVQLGIITLNDIKDPLLMAEVEALLNQG